jgi:hypothetical protein
LVGVFDIAPFFQADAVPLLTVARLLLRHLFLVFIPIITGRFFPSDEGHGPRQRDGYQVTPKLSLSCPMHAGKKPRSVQKLSPRLVKQAAYGETRTAIHQKKTYEK